MPGFNPAAELVTWRVPNGATFVDSAKGPKTIDAPSGLIKLGERRPWVGGPTPGAHTRPANGSERSPLGPGGRRRSEAREIWNSYCFLQMMQRRFSC